MNWARMDNDALQAVAEYLQEARDRFPEGENIEENDLNELLVTYVHLILCVHTLLLNCYPKYRDAEEHSMWCRKLGITDEGDV